MSGFEPKRLGFWGRLCFALSGLSWTLGAPGVAIAWVYTRVDASAIFAIGFAGLIVSAMLFWGACELVDWILKGREVDERKILAAIDEVHRRFGPKGGELSEP